MNAPPILLTERETVCQRDLDSDGFWICHRCGSMWSDMLMGLGWLPLSCPSRVRAASESNPHGR